MLKRMARVPAYRPYQLHHVAQPRPRPRAAVCTRHAAFHGVPRAASPASPGNGILTRRLPEPSVNAMATGISVLGGGDVFDRLGFFLSDNLVPTLCIAAGAAVLFALYHAARGRAFKEPLKKADSANEVMAVMQRLIDGRRWSDVSWAVDYTKDRFGVTGEGAVIVGETTSMLKATGKQAQAGIDMNMMWERLEYELRDGNGDAVDIGMTVYTMLAGEGQNAALHMRLATHRRFEVRRAYLDFMMSFSNGALTLSDMWEQQLPLIERDIRRGVDERNIDLVYGGLSMLSSFVDYDGGEAMVMLLKLAKDHPDPNVREAADVEIGLIERWKEMDGVSSEDEEQGRN